jgi:probable rRNA maturation factor
VNELRVDVQLADGVAAVQAPLLEQLERAVRSTLEHEGITRAAVSLTLMDDAGMAGLNQQYLQHEGPTDVLSFPLYAPGEWPVGDIYIGYDQARRQAEQLQQPFEAELARLAIHGTLHVLGFTHPEEGSREESEMWQRQEAILQQVLQR